MTEDCESPTYPPDVDRFLRRLYDPGSRKWACRATTPDTVRRWQAQARPELCSLLGLDLMQDQLAGHSPSVVLGKAQDCGDHTRQSCTIETEPDVQVPFWLLRPKDGGKLPLVITPHGHDRIGPDTSAGVARNEKHAQVIEEEDRDVAVQAARHGFLAIAPATRGLARGCVTDLFGRFDGSDCTSHFMHGLLAGRSSIGERVWDMQRIIDWASELEEVDSRDILMMGNSGGGVLTTFAAACDTRIGIAMASCSYSPFVGLNGKIQHHHCNAVPGIMAFGEFWDVAGLIAPRHFLAVHGRKDPLKATDEVDRAVEGLRVIYETAEVGRHFRQAYADGGHRFYSDLMWPFIGDAMEVREKLRQHARESSRTP
ncbi:MAG: acetylxylan esterase [Candidatus Latescibacteria bacterium]|nr:acetylxylan esterase [Candidatus Latescibacterota bacterium]